VLWTWLPALIAAAPILLVLVLMVGFGHSAAVAGLAGLALTAALAVGVYGQGAGVLGGASLEGLFLAATILWILLPALAIHGLQETRGTLGTLRDALVRVTSAPALQTILIGWFFGLFMEGAAGFGTPVALAAPLLVALGVEPARAVAIALIGHSLGVSFGAVGTPVIAQAELVAQGGAAIAAATAPIHGALGVILMGAVLLSAGATGAAAWGWGALGAALFLAPMVAIALLVGPELPTLGGALLGAVLFVAAVRRFGPPRSGEAVPGRALARAGAPYLVLIALILPTRLVPPVRAPLEAVAIAWSLPGGFGASVRPLFHPGTMLMAGLLAGGAVQGARAGELGAALVEAAERLVPVTVALVAMLILSRLMLHAGMIDALAGFAADTLGAAFPLTAPLVGALGTFVTGSATASNILFTAFQEATATRLDLPVLLMLAAQGVGAGVGNVICPHNIVAGAAAVGIPGREGAILRRTLPACLIYLAAAGVLVFALAR
jgi:lactate permease